MPFKFRTSASVLVALVSWAMLVQGKDAGKVAEHKIGQKVEEVFRGILVDHWAISLFFAILLIIEEHARALYKKSWLFGDILCNPSGVLRKVGLDIIILQIYYIKDEAPFIKKRPFVLAVALVFFDTFVIYYVMAFVGQILLGMGPEEALQSIWTLGKKNEQDSDDGPDVNPYLPGEDSHTSATSKYMHIALPIRKVFPVFLAQMALMLFYMFYLNTDPDTHDRTKVSYGYWVVGILLQLYAGEQQLGDPYDAYYWKNLFEQGDTTLPKPEEEDEAKYLEDDGLDFSHGGATFNAKNDVQNKSHKVFFFIPAPFWLEWKLRQGMDLLINRLFRSIIIYTFPIMLCVEGPLDFVKDCTAIWFITTLDDLGGDESENNSLDEMLGLLRKRAAWDDRKSHAKAREVQQDQNAGEYMLLNA